MSSSKLFRAIAIARLSAVLVLAFFGCVAAHSQTKPNTSKMPWMNKALSPDERADMVLAQMTLDEKIQMVHGQGWGVLREGAPIPPGSNFGAGFMAGIDRLGIPNVDLADSAVGIRMAAYQGRYATLLPSSLGAAASCALSASTCPSAVAWTSHASPATAATSNTQARIPCWPVP
jgi:beta-glucosidase